MGSLYIETKMDYYNQGEDKMNHVDVTNNGTFISYNDNDIEDDILEEQTQEEKERKAKLEKALDDAFDSFFFPAIQLRNKRR